MITILYTTVEHAQDAFALIGALTDRKLIACGLQLEANSQFPWKGKLVEGDEIVIICKTTPARVSEARKALEELHPYELPMILSWEVSANDSYEKWVASVLHKS